MFSHLVTRIQQQDDRGAVMVEYAMLFVFIVIVAIATLTAFGISVLELYSDNTDRFTGAVQSTAGN